MYAEPYDDERSKHTAKSRLGNSHGSTDVYSCDVRTSEPDTKIMFKNTIYSVFDTYKWKPVEKFSDKMYLLQKISRGRIYYAPMYVFFIEVKPPRSRSIIERQSTKYFEYSSLSSLSDRLRWLRLDRKLTRQEISLQIGLPPRYYGWLEENNIQTIKAEYVNKICSYFSIQPGELLDEYNLFLYSGQGKCIKEFRTKHHMSIPELAKLIGTTKRYLENWENETTVITRDAWNKYIKNKL